MATGMFGADVEALMGVSNTFRMHRDVVDEARSSVADAISGVDWLGPDADSFRESYGESIPAQLAALADKLVDHHDDLARQASDQEEASSSKREEGCLKKTGDFFKGLFNGVVDFVKGVILDGLWSDIKDTLGLIGMNFDGGFSWSLENAGKAWGDMLGGLGALIGRDPETGQWSFGTAGEAWKGLAKNLLAWDEWKDNPARALGHVVWNLGSMLIPGVGEVKIAKWLGKVDVPHPHHVPDAPHDRTPDAPHDRTPEGGAAEHVPPGGERLPDGSVRTPDGRVFDPQHQINDVEPHTRSGDWDPRLNRDVADPHSAFQPNSLITTRDGQTFITNDRGLVEYSSVSGKGSDITPGGRADDLDHHGPTQDYWDHDARDERGHHNPDFMGGTDDNINLTQQSPGANRGSHPSDMGGGHQPGAVHQQLLETRTRDYMLSHPDEHVTWERTTMYDDSGHAVGYRVRVTGEDGPIDLSRTGRGGGYRSDAVPDSDGWVTIVD